nr:lyso-ornithine lipid O-acyltransferase [Candidatus Cloacimonadota bacterium]
MIKIYFLLYNLFYVLEFFLTGWWISLHYKDPIVRRRKYVQSAHKMSGQLLKSLRIDLHLKNSSRLIEMQDQAYLLVSNHISYIDIVALASIQELAFITSVEMGSNPFLGSITRLGGSLYTDRRNPLSLKEEIQKFSAAIRAGFKVGLFPEGTSTSGKSIGKFHRSLFQIAIDTNCPIMPVCVKYTHLDGKPVTDLNRDKIAWYGNMTFAPHILALLGHKIRLEIEILEPIVQPHTKTRSELSEAVFEKMQACYNQK